MTDADEREPMPTIDMTTTTIITAETTVDEPWRCIAVAKTTGERCRGCHSQHFSADDTPLPDEALWAYLCPTHRHILYEDGDLVVCELAAQTATADYRW
jgi:hypothetical protein